MTGRYHVLVCWPASTQVVKLHRRLPPGGVLVFLTGKAEILHMCDRLRKHFNKKKKKSIKQETEEAKDDRKGGRVVGRVCLRLALT